MSVTVPFPVGGTATGWQLTDYQPDVAVVSTPASGGTVVLTVAELATDELWIATHAVVACTSATPTSLRLYSGSIDPRQLLDGSDKGNFDVADWAAGLMLAPGSTLLAVWSGVANGAVATLTLQARVLRRR